MNSHIVSLSDPTFDFPDRERRRSLETLVSLRWFALAGQTLTIVGVVGVYAVPLPWLPMSALLGILAASNLLFGRLQHLEQSWLTGSIVLLDVLLLTGLLFLSGGPANPFSVLYLVHVTLAAIVTTRPWTWAIVATSSAGFALLFAFSLPLPPEFGGRSHAMDSGSYSAHLQGMWLAYAVSATTIGIFVSRLSGALRREREKQERTTRLLGLAALAAGAAHEIGNPLGTIRIAASEMEKELRSKGSSTELLSDVKLINEEVTRAKTVLDRMASAAGELRGEALKPWDSKDLLERALLVPGYEQRRLQRDIAVDLPRVRWPAEAATQAISQLIRNAFQASAPDNAVFFRAWRSNHGVAIEIEDHGVGMDTRVLARVGEPFFTTRPGEGMGLGVFIAQTLIERMGGVINLASKRGGGTTVSVWLPVGVKV